MQKFQLTIFVNIFSLCLSSDLSNELNLLSSTSTKNELSWQQMPQPNWIILKTQLNKESRSDKAHATVNNYGNKIFSDDSAAKNNEKLKFQTQQHQWNENHQHMPINYNTDKQQQQEQQQQQQIPKVNYRLETERATNVQLIEPYIFTISKVRTHAGVKPATGSFIADTSSDFSNVITFPKNILHNFVSLEKERKKDIEIKADNENGNHGRGDDATLIYAKNESNENDNDNDVSVKFLEKIENDGNKFNEIFETLRYTLNKVIYFCDIAKHFIGNNNDIEDDSNDVDDGDDDNDNDYFEEIYANDVNQNISSNKVQGYRNLSPKTSKPFTLLTNTLTGQQSRQKTSNGSGRKIKKLKKKLSKFVLPLLLAYKLKFLALIPVLIGGLILLVGSTGLAGFFFALFTAVMSLKSAGGSKPIIVKKI